VRIAVAVAALGGLLVWEAWTERVRHQVALLLERLPVLVRQMVVDFTSWQLAMVKVAEQLYEATGRLRVTLENRDRRFDPASEVSASGYTVTRPNHPPQVVDMADVVWSPAGSGRMMILGEGVSWTQVPDDSWIDSHSDNGEELERLEQVIEEQRERIRRIGLSEDVAP
jgi:hypothetical protein